MKKKSTSVPAPASWTFLTNHAHVLISLFENPEMRLRDVAVAVGITERAVQKIIAELEDGGLLERERQGRRNVYRIHARLPLRHPVESHCTVQGLLRFVLDSKQKR
ncbi:MAG: winged helix-turn-helix domain-containing protein [Verrucomicrobiaceae bacterium]